MLKKFRQQIDLLDKKILKLLSERATIAKDVAEYKKKSNNTNIFENTLHLDCCFQTISMDKAIVCPDGFKKKDDVEYLIKLFGKKNIFLASPEETFMLTSNVLVISPEIIVSHSKFKRLNKWLEEKGVLVEKVDYSNVSKMSGLFRCSTLPLTREI